MHEILWELPAAIAYQLQIIHHQMQGNDFRRDDRIRIKTKLRELNLSHG